MEKHYTCFHRGCNTFNIRVSFISCCYFTYWLLASSYWLCEEEKCLPPRRINKACGVEARWQNSARLKIAESIHDYSLLNPDYFLPTRSRQTTWTKRSDRNPGKVSRSHQPHVCFLFLCVNSFDSLFSTDFQTEEKNNIWTFFETQIRTLQPQQWSEATEWSPGGRPSTFPLHMEPKALLMKRTAVARVAHRVTLASYFYKQKGVRCVCLWCVPFPPKTDLQ